jgi:hypothetical protein
MIIEHMMLAKGSAIDQESNALSVFDLIEDLTIKGPQGRVVLPLHFIAILKRADEVGSISFTMNLSILKPNAEKPINFPLQVKMQSNHMRFRLRVNLSLEIEPESGLYNFCLNQEDDSRVSRTIEIRITRESG